MPSDISLHKTSLVGGRPTNEDVEKYKLNLSLQGGAINPKFSPIDFFVICDGHGGSHVAEFVAPQLEYFLTQPDITYPLAQQEIVKIYSDIQKELINHPQRIAKMCGCTALVLLRYMDPEGNKNIQIINIGDCRAVLSRKGLAIPLSKDHKPSWPDEKKRIDAVNKKYGTNQQIHFDAGDWRIGDLSVSRAFGDLDNVPHVSHVPDSFCYQLIRDDEFIVMGCDGLYDVLENHEVVNFVRDHMKNNHLEVYNIPHIYPTKEIANQINIARKLAEYALARGSTDNVSIIIIFFENS